MCGVLCDADCALYCIAGVIIWCRRQWVLFDVPFVCPLSSAPFLNKTMSEQKIKGRDCPVKLMLDIETLGSKTETAPVLEVCLVVFNVSKEFPTKPPEHISVNFDLESQLNPPLGYTPRVIEADTLKWWLETNPERLNAMLTRTDVCSWAHGIQFLQTNLANVTEEYGADYLEVFANGPTFDVAIMDSMHRAIYRAPLFNFRAARDFRTIVSLGHALGMRWDSTLTEHTAYDDALRQAKFAWEVYQKMRGLADPMAEPPRGGK